MNCIARERENSRLYTEKKKKRKRTYQSHTRRSLTLSCILQRRRFASARVANHFDYLRALLFAAAANPLSIERERERERKSALEYFVQEEITNDMGLLFSRRRRSINLSRRIEIFRDQETKNTEREREDIYANACVIFFYCILNAE